MKKLKPTGMVHTSKSKMGYGDNYGTGIRAKVGTMREGMGIPAMAPKKIKTPPKSLG